MSGDYPKRGEKWECGCWAEPIDEYACHQHVCQEHTQTRYTSYASIEDLRERLVAESEAAFSAGVSQLRKDRDELLLILEKLLVLKGDDAESEAWTVLERIKGKR